MNETFTLRIMAADEAQARAKALEWAQAEPRLAEPSVQSATPHPEHYQVFSVVVAAEVTVEAAVLEVEHG